MTKEEFVESVRAAGQQIADRSEDYAGDTKLMRSIHIYIDIDDDNAPTINIEREYSVRTNVN